MTAPLQARNSNLTVGNININGSGVSAQARAAAIAACLICGSTQWKNTKMIPRTVSFFGPVEFWGRNLQWTFESIERWQQGNIKWQRIGWWSTKESRVSCFWRFKQNTIRVFIFEKPRNNVLPSVYFEKCVLDQNSNPLRSEMCW